jgi:hypothetical protein
MSGLSALQLLTCPSTNVCGAREDIPGRGLGGLGERVSSLLTTSVTSESFTDSCYIYIDCFACHPYREHLLGLLDFS